MTSQFHILHLSTVHPAHDVRVFHKMARSTAKAGYRTTLVAVAPQSEVRDGVEIVGLKKFKNPWKRIFFAPFFAMREVLKRKPNLVHFHDPELVPWGIVLRILGYKVIYDVHEDLVGQMPSRFWLPRALVPLVGGVARRLELLGARFFSAIIPVAPHIASFFPPDKTLIVCNYPLLEEFRGAPEDHALAADKCAEKGSNIAAYIGGLSQVRGLSQMCEAIMLCKTEGACLVLAGSFAQNKDEACVTHAVQTGKVTYLGRLDRQAIAELLGGATLGLLTIQETENHRLTLPVKLFEYMIAGLPVIAPKFAQWSAIVEENNCGLIVDETSPQAIADAMDWVFSHPEEAKKMGENGRKAVLERYTWEREERKLLDLYQKLLAH